MRQTVHKTKVFYRPVEAAIRWAGLLHEEQVILTCTPLAQSIATIT